MSRTALAALTLTILLTSGCRGAGKQEVALGPLWSQYAGPASVGEAPGGDETLRQRDVLWPLLHAHESDSERGWGIRPLFYQRERKDGLRRETTFLWPLGRLSYKPGEVELRLLPLFGYRARYNEQGTIDRDLLLLPGLIWGSDEKEGDYSGWFPIGGSSRGLIGRDRIDWVLFPLYARTYDKDYRGVNILWPLFAYGRGNGREVTTVLPFYTRRAKAGRYDNRAYLWPIIHVRRTRLQTDNPRTAVFVFPLYGQETSARGDSVSRTVLWPFVSWARNREQDYTELNLPWPFVRYLRSQPIDHTRLWPLWSRWEHKQKRIVEHQLLWPIGWHSTRETDDWSKRSLYVLPLYWQHRTRYADGATAAYTKLWPLFHHARDREGRSERSLLSPWWFRDHTPHGFRDNYDPLFTLFYQRHDPVAGESVVSVLGPLLRFYRRGALTRDNRVLLLRWGWDGRGKGARGRWSLLEGLLGYEARADGARCLRLLWIPIRWGGDS